MASWEQSLDDLVRRRGPALVAYAYLLCGDRAEAEDLVQDALVRVYARVRRGHEPHAVEAYVRSAVLSTYLDGFRRRRRWAAVRHLLPGDASGDGPDTSAPARVDVQRALMSLTPRERACVVLRFYEDLTVPMIADRLSLSQGTVKRYLSDGVRRMEEHVARDAPSSATRPPVPPSSAAPRAAPAPAPVHVLDVELDPRRTR